ncbi:hypothetical protein ACS0TY_019673 [Phlomoides rotata]
MRFVYVLPGWEDSATDCRILRNAILRSNGLKVPMGNYYLGDNDYANSEGYSFRTLGLGITLRSGDHQPKHLSTTKNILTLDIQEHEMS